MFAFSALATVLGLLAVEGVARLVELARPPGPVEARSPLGFQQLPDGDLLVPVEGFSDSWRFAPGLIDDSALLVPPKLPDELRIVVVGGSAVGGWSVARRATFAAELERALDAVAGRPVSVFNLGRIGFASPQIAWMLERTLPLLDADVVLAVMGNNERQDLFVAETLARPRLARLGRALHRRLALARLLSTDRVIDAAADPTPLPERADLGDVGVLEAEADARLGRSIARIAAATERAGAALLVASVPVNHRYRDTAHEWEPLVEIDEARRRQHLAVHLGSPSEDVLAELAELAGVVALRRGHPCAEADRAWFAGRWDDARDLYDGCRGEAKYLRADDRINAALRAGAEAVGARFVDLAASVGALARHGVPGYDVFYDYCHYTPRGNALVGHSLAAAVADVVGLPAPMGAAVAARRFELRWRGREADFLSFAEWVGVSADVTALAALRYRDGQILHVLGEPGSATSAAYAGNRLMDRGSVAEMPWLEAAAARWCEALGLDPTLDAVADNLTWLLGGQAGHHLRTAAGVDEPVAACRAGRPLWDRAGLPTVDQI